MEKSPSKSTLQTAESPRANSRGLLYFFLALLFFTAIAGPFLSLSDPDYFWHYASGQWMVKHLDIPSHDIFSFSLPAFTWVNHEWLSDVVLFIIEEHLGTAALSFWYFILFAGTLYLTTRSMGRHPSAFEVTISILAAGVLLLFSGVRQQTYSFFFFALLLSVIRHPPASQNRNTPWLLPFLFLLWANLHGGFAIGLFALVFYALVRLPDKKYLPIAAFSVAATLINPYGFGIYEEILRTVGDPLIGKYVMEWQPLFLSPVVTLRYSLYGIFAWIFITPVRRLILRHADMAILVILALASFKSIKYVPYAVIASLPYVLAGARLVLTPDRLSSIYRRVFTKPMLVFGPAFALSALIFVWPNIVFPHSGPSYPSVAALEVLRNQSGRNVFSYYGWSGYLIRYVPGKKYFIDGRMPSWRDASTYPFKDYLSVALCENPAEVLNRHKAEIFVWTPVEPQNSVRLPYAREIETAINNLLSEKSPAKSKCSLHNILAGAGWQKIFDDGNTVILTNQ